MCNRIISVALFSNQPSFIKCYLKEGFGFEGVSKAMWRACRKKNDLMEREGVEWDELTLERMEMWPLESPSAASCPSGVQAQAVTRAGTFNLVTAFWSGDHRPAQAVPFHSLFHSFFTNQTGLVFILLNSIFQMGGI